MGAGLPHRCRSPEPGAPEALRQSDKVARQEVFEGSLLPRAAGRGLMPSSADPGPPTWTCRGPLCPAAPPPPRHAPHAASREGLRGWRAWPQGGRKGDRCQLVAGAWGLTLARRCARNGARGVADDGVPLHAGQVGWRATEDAQQFILRAQGWEGADGQLHLGKAMRLTLDPSVQAWGAGRHPQPERLSCVPLLGYSLTRT